MDILKSQNIYGCWIYIEISEYLWIFPNENEKQNFLNFLLPEVNFLLTFISKYLVVNRN